MGRPGQRVQLVRLVSQLMEEAGGNPKCGQGKRGGATGLMEALCGVMGRGGTGSGISGDSGPQLEGRGVTAAEIRYSANRRDQPFWFTSSI